MPLNMPQQSWLPRRSSVSSPSNTTTTHQPPNPTLKGKDRSLNDTDDFGSRYGHNANDGASKSSSSPPTTHDSSSHSVRLHSHLHQQSLLSRHRTSLLSAASDAFGLRKKFGSVARRKPTLYSLSHTSSIEPGVIEINASNNTTFTSTIGGTTAHRDYEHEERERLRDAAAQSIGLDPELLHESKSENRSSLDSPHSPPQPTRIPPFPATLTALRPFVELSATLPKFTSPSSLLVYALAKQWKPRVIVLTSHSPSHNTHVHLFKGSSKDEREIERLEVTEDSVIFVTEEDVGGRRNVVKFAGKDVSAKRSPGTSGEQSAHTMWFLQITDSVESQRWIGAIKNAVLTRRAVRAGLDISAQSDGRNEPKGDIDVMLSMHLQGLISTHPTKPSTAISFSSPHIPASPSPPPSLHSLKLNIPSSSSPTTTMKGIFSGTRPRSPSVEGSPSSSYPPGHPEDSFGIAGTSLLSMLRTKSSADSNSSPSHSLPLPLPHVSGKDSPAPSLRSAYAPAIITASDLKISKERDAPELSTAVPEASSSSTTPNSNTPPTPSLSPQGTLTLSLQPPPRKSKHAVATFPTTSISEQQEMYKQAGGNCSVAGDFGMSSRASGDVTPRETSPPVSPASSSFLVERSAFFDFKMQSPRAGEAHGGEPSDDVTWLGNEIVDPLSSARGRAISSDRLSQCTAITKRWSRQGVPLPKQLTPPSGPPPSVPPSSGNNNRISMESSISIPVTYATDHPPGSPSSNSDSRTRFGSRSGSSLPPTFWKRGSSSSTYSASSSSTSDWRARSQILLGPFSGESSSYGSDVGKGASSRPMSLSVPVSSPVVGAVKRRSMPPPRPAPNFAPPPAPAIQASTSGPTPLMTIPASRKSFRRSVAQRALRLSLTSPKPPPSSALPPRPDEAVFTPGHRRSSSAGSPDFHPISPPSSRPTSALAKSDSTEPVFPPSRSLSITQRLRLLSTPPASPSHSPSFLTPSVQVSTLDLSDDNDDALPTPCFHSPQSFGLGEHIMMQSEPSFLQLSTPVTPTAPKPPLRGPYRSMSQSSSPLLEPGRDFVALSPPPPRRTHAVTVKRPEKCEVLKRSGSAQREESKLVELSQHGSVVSLGFVTSYDM